MPNTVQSTNVNETVQLLPLKKIEDGSWKLGHSHVEIVDLDRGTYDLGIGISVVGSDVIATVNSGLAGGIRPGPQDISGVYSHPRWERTIKQVLTEVQLVELAQYDRQKMLDVFSRELIGEMANCLCLTKEQIELGQRIIAESLVDDELFAKAAKHFKKKYSYGERSLIMHMAENIDFSEVLDEPQRDIWRKRIFLIQLRTRH